MASSIFFKKAFKRLRKILVRVVPYNLALKPVGHHKTIAAYMQSGSAENAACIELYPAHESRINVPETFISRCTKFERMPSVAVAAIPASRIVAVPNGRLYTDGVERVCIITPDNKLLGEVTYQNHPSNKIEENVLLKQMYFIPVRKYKGVVFHTLIGGSGSINYFHWLLDSLPRFHLLKKSGWFEKVDWFLLPALKTDYHRDSIKMLGIPEEKIIESSTETHIQADVLLASTFVRHYEHVPIWCCHFLREHFLKPQAFSGKHTHPLIYISRKDATRRRILNEPALEQMLHRYGFKTYELARLPFSEKIELFHNARVIIAPHGAGQTNLVFCSSGAKMLELIPEGFAFTYFYDIANKVGVHYHYLFLQSDPNANTMAKRMYMDSVADLEAIRGKLDAFLIVEGVQV